jgi:hypothetical protein
MFVAAALPIVIGLSIPEFTGHGIIGFSAALAVVSLVLEEWGRKKHLA